MRDIFKTALIYIGVLAALSLVLILFLSGGRLALAMGQVFSSWLNAGSALGNWVSTLILIGIIAFFSWLLLVLLKLLGIKSAATVLGTTGKMKFLRNIAGAGRIVGLQAPRKLTSLGTKQAKRGLTGFGKGFKTGMERIGMGQAPVSPEKLKKGAWMSRLAGKRSWSKAFSKAAMLEEGAISLGMLTRPSELGANKLSSLDELSETSKKALETNKRSIVTAAQSRGLSEDVQAQLLAMLEQQALRDGSMEVMSTASIDKFINERDDAIEDSLAGLSNPALNRKYGPNIATEVARARQQTMKDRDKAENEADLKGRAKSRRAQQEDQPDFDPSKEGVGSQEDKEAHRQAHKSAKASRQTVKDWLSSKVNFPFSRKKNREDVERDAEALNNDAHSQPGGSDSDEPYKGKQAHEHRQDKERDEKGRPLPEREGEVPRNARVISASVLADGSVLNEIPGTDEELRQILADQTGTVEYTNRRSEALHQEYEQAVQKEEQLRDLVNEEKVAAHKEALSQHGGSPQSANAYQAQVENIRDNALKDRGNEVLRSEAEIISNEYAKFNPVTGSINTMEEARAQIVRERELRQENPALTAQDTYRYVEAMNQAIDSGRLFNDSQMAQIMASTVATAMVPHLIQAYGKPVEPSAPPPTPQGMPNGRWDPEARAQARREFENHPTNLVNNAIKDISSSDTMKQAMHTVTNYVVNNNMGAARNYVAHASRAEAQKVAEQAYGQSLASMPADKQAAALRDVDHMEMAIRMALEKMARGAQDRALRESQNPSADEDSGEDQKENKNNQEENNKDQEENKNKRKENKNKQKNNAGDNKPRPINEEMPES